MTIKGSSETSFRRKLRLGMVGGGRGAFIGAVHRMAARLDDKFDLVAGALSSDPAVGSASAADIGITADRSYRDWQEMVEREAARDDGIDVVSIVTPNHLHFAVSKAFLEAGINIICDKPMTLTLAEARDLERIVDRSGLVFVLTQNNTGYPMVRQARKIVNDGKIGTVRLIRTSYVQDWLTTKLEDTGQKQATWRMNPVLAGAGGVVADIGVHAFNLAAFISGMELDSVAADLQSYGDGRSLNDNANVLLRYTNGATGTLWATQCAPGHNNSLTIGVYGDKGSVEWDGERNDYLTLNAYGAPPQIITRGGPGADEIAAFVTRMPAGHPEGYIEGFANLYSNAAEQIWSKIEGRAPHELSVDTPTVRDGVRGLEFIEACITSSRDNGGWTKLR